LKHTDHSFSIITICYNCENSIEKTILSVLNQNYKNFEYIIIDGNSKDNTVNIINKYKTKIDKIIIENDKGIYDALNKGIALAKNEIIGFLHAGDIYFSNDVLTEYNRNFIEDIDIIYSNLIIKNYSNNKIIRDWKSSQFLINNFYKGWSPPHPTFYAKKKCYINNGNFDLNYKISSDIDLMFRYLEVKKIKSRYINKYSIIMESGGLSNKNILNKIKLNLEIIKILKSHNPKFSILVFLFKKFFLKFYQYI